MSVRYLFNSDGDYVAFISGENVFSPSAEWLGFLQKGTLFYSPKGEFIGHVLNDDRVVRNRIEPKRSRILRPLRPLRPLTPLRPLRRLRVSAPRYPYEDVFEKRVSVTALNDQQAFGSVAQFEGADIYAADDAFLGRINRNKYDQSSLANPYQPYGSKYSQNSILNKYSQYGSPYNQLSPFNKFSTTPPRIVKNEKVLAYLSANQFVSPRLDPSLLLGWLGIETA